MHSIASADLCGKPCCHSTLPACQSAGPIRVSFAGSLATLHSQLMMHNQPSEVTDALCAARADGQHACRLAARALGAP